MRYQELKGEALEKELEAKEKELLHRKGKGGLVWSIRREISDIEFEIGELKRKKDELSKNEEELSRLSDSLGKIEKRRSELESERARMAYVLEYTRKKEEIAKIRSSIECEKEFFKNASTTKKEAREMEEKSKKAKALFESIKTDRETVNTHFVDDSPVAEQHITAIKQSESIKIVNKTFHIHIIIAGICTLSGILLGLLITPILFLLLLPAALFAFLAMQNIGALKK